MNYQQGKNADEHAEMRYNVKWMSGKMNEQKRKIVWLTVGMAVMVVLFFFLLVVWCELGI